MTTSTMTRYGLLIGVIWSLLSHPAHGCYLIQTTTGEFATTGYWREGAELKLFMPGGIIGLPVSDIMNITRLSNGERGRQCHGSVAKSEEQPAESAPPDAPAVLAAPVAGEAGVPTSTYRDFETEVLAFERDLGRIGLMPMEELYGLARIGEGLKKKMLARGAVAGLTGLLARVHDGLEKIEGLLRAE